jgi:ubiquinone/menaquinone biosynthesis C-methylase UbiE
MIKLTEQNEKNSPLEYDKIYLERLKKGVDQFDIRRWKKLLKKYKGSNLIDLGCLDSQVPFYAHERFPNAEIWGVDLAEETVKSMQDRYPFAIFEVADVYKTKYPSDYFGYAVAGEIMEHLEFPQKFLEETFRILRPGGILALSTPKEEIVEPGAIDKDRHLWSYSIEDITALLSPFGTVETEILGSKYFPFYKYSFPNIIAFCKKK